MAITKKISIIDSNTSNKETRDIGSEAQNVTISRNSSGTVIEDITSPSASVASTESLATSIKNIGTVLNEKQDRDYVNSNYASLNENGKVLMEQLPDWVDDVINGYYNTTDGKFYKNPNFTVEIQGTHDKIYIDLNTNIMYRWADGDFINISNISDTSLGSLDNVSLGQTIKDGESLIYDSTLNKWINKMGTIRFIPRPEITGPNSFTYNGSSQGPAYTKSTDIDFDEYVITRGENATYAGNYKLEFELKDTSSTIWDNGSSNNIEYPYVINKANGSVTLSKNSVSLEADHTSDSITFSNATGIVSATSSDTGIATVSIINNTIVITATEETGTCTINVNVAGDSDYNAYTTTINVSATFIALVGWSTGTDQQITDMVNAYYNNKITLAQIQQVWHVGESRTVHLSAMSATGVGESHREQDVEMVILDFEHDLLIDSSSGKTKALVTLGQKDCLRDATVTDEQGGSNTERGYINSTNDNSTGWNTCARRTWCNSVYYNALPSYLKSLVRQVKKSTAATGNTSSPTWYVNHDYCFLPSEWEVFGAKSYSAETGQNATHIDKDANDVSITMPAGGTQYSWYTTAENRRKLPKWNSSSDSSFWWERSPYASNATSFCIVDISGGAYSYRASSAIGIAPSCCL